MTNSELQTILYKNINARYTPFAFTCECGGKDWDCENALDDPYLNGVMDTVRRIAEYVLEFNPEG